MWFKKLGKEMYQDMKNISTDICVCLSFAVELLLYFTVTGDVNLITRRDYILLSTVSMHSGTGRFTSHTGGTGFKVWHMTSCTLSFFFHYCVPNIKSGHNRCSKVLLNDWLNKLEELVTTFKTEFEPQNVFLFIYVLGNFTKNLAEVI